MQRPAVDGSPGAGGPPGAAAAAPKLAFAVEEGGVLQHSVGPTLCFALRVGAGDGVAVRSVALNVELRLAATRRRHDAREERRLVELFGPVEQWGRSLTTLHWATTTLQVPPFTGSALVDLHVPCTYDLEVTASKYLDALADGTVPLEFLFSGTVFYAGSGGLLQVARIDWESEAAYDLPVAVWREMMDRHFPDSSWLRLRRDQFDRLATYRAGNALLTWEATVDALLDAAARDEEHRS